MVDPELQTWLDDHVDLERGVGIVPSRRATAPTLERIRGALELLGDPQRDVPVVHVTGTNGKTSTVRMCAALLDGVGLNAGTYTSPHLVSMNERIGLHGDPISEEALGSLLETVRLVEGSLLEPLSYFEILTACAFRYFADEALDVAVVEVGLGGTWDATNVVDAQVAVITNVSIDHVEYLGPTRRDIAADKVGIVGPDSTFVLGETAAELADVFDARPCATRLRRGVDFGAVSNRLAVGGRLLDLTTPWSESSDVYLPLHGAHQGDNAAVALAAAEAFLGRGIDAEVVHGTFAGVQSPGRLEVVDRNPLVILDGAHNVGGAEMLTSALAEAFPAAHRTLVVGLLAQKDPEEMLRALDVAGAQRLVCCRPPSPRGRDPQDLAAAARRLGVADDQIDVCATTKEAIGAAMLETPSDGQIVVTGTLYTVGEARSLFVDDEHEAGGPGAGGTPLGPGA